MLLSRKGHSVPLFVDPHDSLTVRTVAEAFANDVASVTGSKPAILSSLKSANSTDVVLVGVLGSSPAIDAMSAKGQLKVDSIRGKWESALVQIVPKPAPGIHRALVIAGSDRRGAAFALFTISRAIGVSPWNWWADVPVKQHSEVWIRPGRYEQGEPSVKYRGIFLNDEEFGLIPWASARMDPKLHNIGPHTYERIFELLLRLRANSLWPAMHSTSLAFNAVPENAKLADKWGIVMGSSHSEILLRNNVGEWDPSKDGPWNYQTNHERMDRYWADRLKQNGGYENFYTVGLRGRHDGPLEGVGTSEVKVQLVEQAMAKQRQILSGYVNKDVQKVPQIIWLYKEALDLYRVGMRVPDDVALGWVDDNYGYIRELPNAEEQRRPGGSGMYYHVSYRGDPNDYLWLCTTPPALIREEMTKAFDHGVRRYWVVNVGDLKPAEMDIDYFFRLAWDEPQVAQVDQTSFIKSWMSEQFPVLDSASLAALMDDYYHLNFVRRPESMGFNGKNTPVNRTDFNPLAWGDQNERRISEWRKLSDRVEKITRTVPTSYSDAWFELVQYPLQAAAALNEKVLRTDRTYLDASAGDRTALASDGRDAEAAYATIQRLTAEYNSLAHGKWDGMMSASPNDKDVFQAPRVAKAVDTNVTLPKSWRADSGPDPAPTSQGFVEYQKTISIEATHYTRKLDGSRETWKVLPELGISGESIYFGQPGIPTADSINAKPTTTAPWLEYDFVSATDDDAKLAIHILPSFPIDSRHRLRFAFSVDGGPPQTIDAAGSGEWYEANDPKAQVWMGNVVRNSAIMRAPLGKLKPGSHTIRLIYQDPGVVFEHVVITFDGAPPAYPVPPETTSRAIASFVSVRQN